MATSPRQTALITGATSGIGLELAKLFAADNYNLVIVARDEIDLQNTASELRQISGEIEVTSISKDLFDRDSAYEIYREVQAQGLHIDVLVNDAGQGHYGLFAETDLEKELKIIDLNVASTVILTKLFLKDMLTRGFGGILNVGSIAGEAPGPWHSVYHGTKAFINSWTAALRYELKDSNIAVTNLLPGPTATDFFNKAEMQDSKITDSPMADPASVAKDGYEAFMAGDDKVISGFKNKVQTTMANMSPDSMAAASMASQQERKGT